MSKLHAFITFFFLIFLQTVFGANSRPVWIIQLYCLAIAGIRQCFRQRRNVCLQAELLGGRIVVAGRVEGVVVVVDGAVLGRIGAELEDVLVERLHLAFVRNRLDVVLVGVRRLEEATLKKTIVNFVLYDLTDFFPRFMWLSENDVWLI